MRVLREDERSLEVPGLDAALACAPYASPLRELLVRAKYAGDPHPLTALADLFAELVPVDADVVVPVPLSRARRRRRGYDQVEPLARAVAIAQRCRLDRRALKRVRGGEAQAGLSRAARLRNLVGKFTCSGDVAGQRVLLVDDVVTTGATLEASAQVLRDSGARSVTAACLFRTLSPSAQK